jgi:hypothetical protein
MSMVSAFLHIEIVHSDPVSAGKFLEEVFGAELVEENQARYVERILPGSKIVHMRMGKVVFQIVRPTEALASWDEQLKTQGPSIHNVSLQVDDMASIEKAMLERGCKVYSDALVDLREAGVDCPGPLRALNIDARKQSGMRFEMLPKEYGYSSALADGQSAIPRRIG